MTDPTTIPPSDPTASISDWEIQLACQQQLDAELMARNKATVFGVLAAAGVTIVAVTFDGYGDSGQIENIETQAGESVVRLPTASVEIAAPAWGQSDPKCSTLSLRDAIEHLAYDVLEQTHSGWEDHDGAYGDIVFNVAERTITLDYNERHMESDYSQHVF